MNAGAFATSLVLLVGCVEPSGATVEHVGACDGRITTTPILDSPHQDYGSPIAWPMNPPTSGPHWGVWPEWDRAYVELPRALWLHSAEHGGVVFASRCAECDDFDRLIDVVRARPDDPHCAPPLRHRAIVTSDPLLPDGVTVAAIAWGVAYTASCLDETELHAFADAHYGRAAENTCAEGVALGGTAF